MLYTGQRRSDIHRMTWADVSAATLRVVQQKTNSKLIIPLHHDLKDLLNQAVRAHVTILNTEYGKPFTVDGFSQWMRAAISAAGLPLGCQPHGLRKAAGRQLAEAGCTANEIMSVLGHKTLAEAERYTRHADQARLAKSAVSKLEGHGEQKVPNRGPMVWENWKKRRQFRVNKSGLALRTRTPVFAVSGFKASTGSASRRRHNEISLRSLRRPIGDRSVYTSKTCEAPVLVGKLKLAIVAPSADLCVTMVSRVISDSPHDRQAF